MNYYEQIIQKIEHLLNDFFERDCKERAIKELQQKLENREFGLKAELEVIDWFLEHNPNNKKHLILYPEPSEPCSGKKADLSIEPQDRRIFIEISSFEASKWEVGFRKICRDLDAKLKKEVKNVRVGIKQEGIIENNQRHIEVDKTVSRIWEHICKENLVETWQRKEFPETGYLETDSYNPEDATPHFHYAAGFSPLSEPSAGRLCTKILEKSKQLPESDAKGLASPGVVILKVEEPPTLYESDIRNFFHSCKIRPKIEHLTNVVLYQAKYASKSCQIFENCESRQGRRLTFYELKAFLV